MSVVAVVVAVVVAIVVNDAVVVSVVVICCCYPEDIFVYSRDFYLTCLGAELSFICKVVFAT